MLAYIVGPLILAAITFGLAVPKYMFGSDMTFYEALPRCLAFAGGTGLVGAAGSVIVRFWPMSRNK